MTVYLMYEAQEEGSKWKEFIESMPQEATFFFDWPETLLNEC